MHKSIFRYVSVILLTLCFSSAFADQGAADLSNMLEAVKTMQADFTQLIFDNKGKKVQQSLGRMSMQRPGKFRWETTKPIPQLIIANDSKIWIYDPDLEQVTIRQLKKTTGETPALLLSHVGSGLEDEFTVKELPKKTPGWQWFALIPKKADSMFAGVEMGFTNHEIHEMHLKDNLGHTTSIKFNKIKTNMVLASSVFIFKSKSKVDVIDETRH